MNTPRFGTLEVLCHTPENDVGTTPLLFIHGAYAGAWCWSEHFLPWFAAHGRSVYAMSLSGHGASPQREHIDSYSIDHYVDDVIRVATQLPAPPVLVGHSMGGMVVQKCLERFDAPGAVLMASVPPQGLMASAFGLMLKKPGVLFDLNRVMGGGMAQVESLRDALFHQPVDTADLQRYYALSQPESHRAIWDMTLFNLPRIARRRHPPMLVMGASEDVLIPPEQVRMTAEAYGLEAEIFDDMGHAMMLERDWPMVAKRIDGWLIEHKL